MDSFSSEVAPSSSKAVSFSESYDKVIYDLEDSGKEEESDEDFIKYNSGESETFSSNDNDDLEMVERVMNCVYMSTKSTVKYLGCCQWKENHYYCSTKTWYIANYY